MILSKLKNRTERNLSNSGVSDKLLNLISFMKASWIKVNTYVDINRVYCTTELSLVEESIQIILLQKKKYSVVHIVF